VCGGGGGSAAAPATAGALKSSRMALAAPSSSASTGIAAHGRNLDPCRPMEIRERALRDLARMLTRIPDEAIAQAYDDLKRHGIAWKLVALVNELVACGGGAPGAAPPAGECPSPPSAAGTLLRWCLSCLANLTYFGGVDLLGEPGVLHILLFALSSPDPTVVSYAVVGMSNVSGDTQCADFLDTSGALPRLQEIALCEEKPDVARRARRILANVEHVREERRVAKASLLRGCRCAKSAWSWHATALGGALGLLLLAFLLVYLWIWLSEADDSRLLVGVAPAAIDEALSKEITAHPHIALHDAVEQTHVYS